MRAPLIPDTAHRTAPAGLVLEQLKWAGCARLYRLGYDAEASRIAGAALAELAGDDRRLDGGDVINRTIGEGLGQADSFWRSRDVETGRWLARGLARLSGDDVPTPHYLPARCFTLSLERRFKFDRIPADRKLRLRLPLPIEDAHLSDLRIECNAGDVRRLNDRLELSHMVGDDPLLALGVRYSFLALAGLPHAEPLTPKDREMWLRHDEGGIQVTSAVRALADQLATDTPPVEAVRAFRDHLLDEFACGYVHYDRIGAVPATDWALRHRWVDCRLGAALLVSLCRARGIPARLVGGYLLWDAPAEHYWMEAWIDGQGWVSHDLLAWGLSAAGTDPAWRDIYDGWTDYRMKTQIFPERFTGRPGVPVPLAQHRLHSLVQGGTRARVLAARDGREIYSDTIRVAG